MKKTILIALTGCLPVGVAMAQSKITIYGTVGLGITHLSNSTGATLIQDSGVLRAGRLGFTGTEDLGSGLSAVFTLEQGIFADTGTVGQGGRGFGRQSWVGLSSTSFGTLSLGRQYDMMNRLVRYSTAGDVGAVYAFHHGDYDRVSGFRIDNSAKYTSPVIGGFQAAFLVAPGEQTGARAVSSGLSYVDGPLDVAASYAKSHQQTINPSNDLGVATFLGAKAGLLVADTVNPRGLGIGYTLGNFRPHLAYTSVRITSADRAASLNSLDLGGSYRVGVGSIGLGVTHSKLEGASWTQYSVGYIHNLSTRTKVYANINYQKASGTARNAVMTTLVAAAERSQLAPHIGLTHDF